jgi:transcriptional regulator with XRE-family HTH domain
MTSYQMRLTDRERKVGRAVYRTQRQIIRALAKAKDKKGLTQQALAEKLGVDRSVINRRVTGRANLTLRTLAELAWALGCELDVQFVE